MRQTAAGGKCVAQVSAEQVRASRTMRVGLGFISLLFLELIGSGRREPISKIGTAGIKIGQPSLFYDASLDCLARRHLARGRAAALASELDTVFTLVLPRRVGNKSVVVHRESTYSRAAKDATPGLGSLASHFTVQSRGGGK
ncbi:MAG TPA: hypothetical protein VFN13_00510 [Rudaea sp.]|nr:hypothetical protein [Rudaea sp.]